ncbi:MULTISPECIES: hypothetical protein [Prochlorococcus]|uniref:hypothetical protein n=1 Tax=Prochlorococcus TaxID=1218 RepID=UPI000533ADDC|nr:MULTISPECIES: hypothetical protein [Prochlorococcus]KGG12702.1 hypothetical protein EV05_1920 [Prochlorococcus sp. MIT 0601]
MSNQIPKQIWSSVEHLVHLSELKYKLRDFRGAIEDKRKARELISLCLNIKGAEGQFKKLIRLSKGDKIKYDLIDDYKGKLDFTKREELVFKLEQVSEEKYNSGDYKGSIRALRRSEKYY